MSRSSQPFARARVDDMEDEGVREKGRKRAASEVFIDGDESTSDPTVMVPYITNVGEVPRRVEVERKKRLYAMQDIAELIKAEGIDELDFGFDQRRLPLYWFDDTNFEHRLPSKWVDKVSKVYAEGAFINYEGKCIWKDCAVLDFVEDTNTYLVQWDDTGQTSWLPRIQVHFMAEDPFLFAKRMVQACKLREEAENLMKYNLYINGMPVEDITSLGEDQTSRILGLVYNTKEVRESNIVMTDRIREVNLDYAHAMNKIVFDGSLARKPTSCKDFILPLKMDVPPRSPNIVPQYGCLQIPKYDFEERCSEFHFSSCLTRPEVLVANVKLRPECNKILSASLFNTHYTKSLRLEEFEQMQFQTIEQTSVYLRDSWTMLLKNIIRSSFKDVGKGWFNIKEQSMEAYEFSKMRRYLHVVQYMMEDSIRFLVEDGLTNFCNFIERHCGSARVDIRSLDTVITTWPSHDYGVSSFLVLNDLYGWTRFLKCKLNVQRSGCEVIHIVLNFHNLKFGLTFSTSIKLAIWWLRHKGSVSLFG